MYTFYKNFTALLVIVLITLLVINPTQAVTKKSSEQNRNAVSHSRLILVPKLTAGLLIGDAANMAEAIDNRFSSRLLYGGGFAAELYLTTSIATTLQFEWTFKKIPGATYRPPIEGLSTSVGIIYKPFPERRNSVYLKGEIGSIEMTVPEYSPNLFVTPHDFDLGTFGFYRLGIGFMNYFVPMGSLRAEFYYKLIRSRRDKISSIDGGDFNISYIGLDLGWGINIFPFK